MSMPVYNTQFLVQRDDVPALVINPNNPPPWLQNSTAQIVYVQNYVQPYMNVDQSMYVQQYVQNPMYMNMDPRIIVDANQIYQAQPIAPTEKNFIQIRPVRPTRTIRPRAYKQIQPRMRYPNMGVQNMQINETIMADVKPNVAMSAANNLNTFNANNIVNRTVGNVTINESLNPNWNRPGNCVAFNPNRARINAASNCNLGPNTLYNITNIPPNSINVNPATIMANNAGNTNAISDNINGKVNLTIPNIVANAKSDTSMSFTANNVINTSNNIPINIAWSSSNAAANIGSNFINIAPINGTIRSNAPNLTQAPNVNTVGPILEANDAIVQTDVSQNVNVTKKINQSIDPNPTKKLSNEPIHEPPAGEKPVITITRIDNRKRKSESPDEIKNKLHILDLNKRDKVRNTVFTQARGRLLKKNAKENEMPVDDNIRKINRGVMTDDVMKLTEKDFVLTHVLDGFVIQESNVAFPIRKPTVEKTIRLSSDALKDLEDEIPSVAIVKEAKSREVIDEKQNGTGNSKINATESHEKGETELSKSEGNPFYGVTRADIKKWTVEYLTNRLSSSGWEDTSAALYEHEIDGESLLLVSKSQLLVIGVKEAHADAIMAFVNS